MLSVSKFNRYGSIYRITNRVNGKAYVGLTTYPVRSRWRRHLSSGRYALHSAIKKYGRIQFEVEELYVAFNRKELIRAERYFIRTLKTIAPDGYNLTSGGDGVTMTAEIREKISAAQKGVKKSLRSRRRMSKAAKGRVPWNKGKSASEESRAKMSMAARGRVPWNKGVPQTDEVKLKLSLAAKARHRV